MCAADRHRCKLVHWLTLNGETIYPAWMLNVTWRHGTTLIGQIECIHRPASRPIDMWRRHCEIIAPRNNFSINCKTALSNLINKWDHVVTLCNRRRVERMIVARWWWRALFVFGTVYSRHVRGEGTIWRWFKLKHSINVGRGSTSALLLMQFSK